MHFKLGVFDDGEYEFLVQYHKIMSLVASALKVVEADRYTFGVYLPTLLGLKLKLQALYDDCHATFECLPLILALQNGLKNRFGELMDPFCASGKSLPLYVAMLSNPTYKMNFMGMKTVSPQLLLRLKTMLLNAAIEIEDENNQDFHSDSNLGVPAVGRSESFFTVFFTSHCKKAKIIYFFYSLCVRTATDTNQNPNSLLIENVVCIDDMEDRRSRIMTEIEYYLREKTNKSVEDGLKDYPIIRKIFLKFNCIKSSEAICERMFSYAGNFQFHFDRKK